ncbi:MAG: hypothetical protein LBT20_07655, partial [Clostridiales bacterium]|nr:hypothetical protein [Clostridiales bacterium]
TLGGSGSDYFFDTAVTTDSGYVFVGQTDSFYTGERGTAIKTDSRGKIVWQKAFGGEGISQLHAVAATSDGGAVLVGYSDTVGTGLSMLSSVAKGTFRYYEGEIRYYFDLSLPSYYAPSPDGSEPETQGNTMWNNNGGEDAVVVKLDSDGKVKWSKNFGGIGNERFQDVAIAPDGSIYLTGYSDGESLGLGERNWKNHGQRDAIAVKLSADGTVEWAKSFGESGDDVFESVAVSPSGIVFAGYSDGAENAGKFDIMVSKTDVSGEIIWSKTFGSADDDRAYSVAPLNDGGYVVAGFARGDSIGIAGGWHILGSNDDALAVKLDKDGDFVWIKTYGSSRSDKFFSVAEKLDGGLIFAGMSSGANGALWGNGGGGVSDALAVETDASGALVWAQNFGGAYAERFESVAVTRYGYIFAGYTMGESPLWGHIGTNGTSADALILSINFSPREPDPDQSEEPNQPDSPDQPNAPTFVPKLKNGTVTLAVMVAVVSGLVLISFFVFWSVADKKDKEDKEE